MKKIILFSNIIILLISCNATNTASCHKIITFVNKTNKTIYVDVSGEYPETDFRKSIGDPLNNSFTTKVEANNSSQNVLPTYGNCYEAIYPSRIKSGIMMVYVFDGPTLETQGWDYIKANNLVLKRYDLTLKNLEDMNWTITYDGN
jgi:hypothetical protein